MNESEFEKMAREIMERFFVQFGEMSSANPDKESIISAALRTAYQAGMREGMKFENKLMMSHLKKPRGSPSNA